MKQRRGLATRKGIALLFVGLLFILTSENPSKPHLQIILQDNYINC